MNVVTLVVRSILLDAIDVLDIEKSAGGIEKEYQWYDKKYYTVSDVVGMSAKKTSKLPSNFQVEYFGSGSVIKSMSSEAGSMIVEVSVVRLMLGD